jgi:hypothetical protein
MVPRHFALKDFGDRGTTVPGILIGHLQNSINNWLVVTLALIIMHRSVNI